MDVQAFETAVTTQFPNLAADYLDEPHAGLRIEIFARYTRQAITARNRDALGDLFTFAGESLAQADLPLKRFLLCHYLTHLHFTGLSPEEGRELQKLMPANLYREWIEMNAIINQVEQAEQGGHQ